MKFRTQKKRLLLVLMILAIGVPVFGQDSHDAKTTKRIANRDRLASVLETSGPKINVNFKQSEKQPFNFVGSYKKAGTNAESYEIVVGVTADDTIGFRIYPHYDGGYINVEKVRNGPALMRQLLRFSDLNFLFWGADATGDVFSGYTFTLESGIPVEAIDVVVRSIPNLDKYVGQVKPYIDGSAAPSD